MSQIGLMASNRGETKSQARIQCCPLMDKMSKEQESLLWHLYELMREMG